MNLRASILALIAAASLAATPAWADRGHGHGGGWGWGPAGFLLGTALLFAAVQPQTYYGPPVYAAPTYGPVVQPYYEPSYAVSNAVLPPPPSAVAQVPAVAASGGWWYFCKSPVGYYPYVQQCNSGWEKVSPVPPGAARP